MRFDIQNDSNVIALLSNSAAVAADTQTNYIDTALYESLLIAVIYDAGTASAGNSFTPTLQEATGTPGTIASYSSVAAADINGAFSAIEATGEGVQFVGYTGDERYINVLLDETGTSSIDFTVVAIVSNGLHNPIDGATITSGTVT